MEYTITIDRELYEYLRVHASLGESGCSVVKRLLGVGQKANTSTPLKVPPKSSAEMLTPREQVLVNFLKGPVFKSQKSAVMKFLAVLGFLYAENKDAFPAAEQIRGRSRKYFSTNYNELEQSGKSVFPKQIPNSNYWVVTNSDSESKRGLLLDVMKVLNYGLGGVVAAVEFGKAIGIDLPTAAD